MKNVVRFLFELGQVTSFLLASSLLAQPNGVKPGEELFHPTRVIAKLADQGKTAAKDAMLKKHGLKVHRQFRMLPQVAVLDLADENEAKVVKALPPQARAKGLWDRIAALQATGLFEYVEPDYIP
jgi:hypothetical protein